MGNYQELMDFIESENYAKAEEFCTSCIQQSKNDIFWKTQLGYVYFLNESDLESYYEKAPAVFASLAQEYPNDENIHFWLGYIYQISLHDSDKAQLAIVKALELNPDHPYANLVLAGMVEDDRSIALLQKVLQKQPCNFNAIRQLVLLQMSDNKPNEAESLLRFMLENEAYTEQDYGIMNPYINEVFTGATQEKKWQKEALKQLGTL